MFIIIWVSDYNCFQRILSRPFQLLENILNEEKLMRQAQSHRVKNKHHKTQHFNGIQFKLVFYLQMERTIFTISPITTADIILEGNGFKTTNCSTVKSQEDEDAVQKIQLQKQRIESLRKENIELQRILQQRLQTIEKLQKENKCANEANSKNQFLKQKLQKTTQQLNSARKQSEQLRRKLSNLQKSEKQLEKSTEKSQSPQDLSLIWAELLANRQLITKTQTALLNQLQQYRKALQQSYQKQNQTLSSELNTLRALTTSDKENCRSTGSGNSLQFSDTFKQHQSCQNCQNLMSEISELKLKETHFLKQIDKLQDEHTTQLNIQKRKVRLLTSQIQTLKLDYEQKIQTLKKQYREQKFQKKREKQIHDTKLVQFQNTGSQMAALRLKLDRQSQNRQSRLIQKLMLQLHNLEAENQQFRRSLLSDTSSTEEDENYLERKRSELSSLRKEETFRLGYMLSDLKVRTPPNFPHCSSGYLLNTRGFIGRKY